MAGSAPGAPRARGRTSLNLLAFPPTNPIARFLRLRQRRPGVGTSHAYRCQTRQRTGCDRQLRGAEASGAGGVQIRGRGAEVRLSLRAAIADGAAMEAALIIAATL